MASPTQGNQKKKTPRPRRPALQIPPDAIEIYITRPSTREPGLVYPGRCKTNYKYFPLLPLLPVFWS